LFYLGRNDDQVKIRGYRVEPAEIAVAVRTHPDVRDCMIRAWHRTDDDIRLVAYVVAHEDLPPQTLVPYLRERLPDHLVPRHYVALPAIPHTINGKVDTDRLPDPVPG
jgi:acyl-coenzyme A synthetase/AMP-(fatty) acid ligase